MWNYHKVLATAKAVEIYRSGNYGGRIGCILNPEMVYARSNSPEDQKAAYMYDLFYNRVFFDPMVKGTTQKSSWSCVKNNRFISILQQRI